MAMRNVVPVCVGVITEILGISIRDEDTILPRLIRYLQPVNLVSCIRTLQSVLGCSSKMQSMFCGARRWQIIVNMVLAQIQKTPDIAGRDANPTTHIASDTIQYIRQDRGSDSGHSLF